jgi:MoaE-MoaD fusion protein
VSDCEGITVRIRLFAMLRERAGRNSLELELAAGSTVADALRALSTEASLGEILSRMPVRLAVNRDYASAETVLAAGDELALIPPVSGGSSETDSLEGPRVLITEEPLSITALSDAVGHPGAGAIAVFQGVTREVERLHYEAYAEMARERIEAIMRECIQAHDLLAGAVAHRVGEVPLGEPSVIVAVSAAHRSEAFDGAREAIDRLKAEAPIWKREDRSGQPGHWVTGTEPSR